MTGRSVSSTGALIAAALLLSSVTMGVAVPCLAQSSDAGGADLAQEMTVARNLIERIIDRYESASSYRITFRQESYWALADTVIASDGVLLLKRPSLLSVRYDDGSTITSNGDTLWVYMSQTNQYFVTDIDAEDTVIDPPRVLRQYVPDQQAPYTGPPPPGSAADGESVPPSAVAEATLHLVPKDLSGEPERLDVVIDPGRALVTGMTAYTRSGDYTRYRIRETRFGVETQPADFEASVPAGAERIGG